MALGYARNGEPVGLVSTDHQTGGRGRFDRRWVTPPKSALTFSAIHWAYADFPAIPILGMAWAVAVAEACNAELQWPNDVVLNGKKLAGILTEIARDPDGRSVPVVGIGVNLTQTEFPPEIAHRATSFADSGRVSPTAGTLLAAILSRAESLPEPNSWNDIRDRWMLRDATPGKIMRLPDGRIVVAEGISDNGSLIGTSEGQEIVTPVAEAFYGV